MTRNEAEAIASGVELGRIIDKRERCPYYQRLARFLSETSQCFAYASRVADHDKRQREEFQSKSNEAAELAELVESWK